MKQSLRNHKIKIRRLLTGWLALCLAAVFFTSCTAGAAAQQTSPYSPREMAEVILAAQPQTPVLYALEKDDADFAARLQTEYLLDAAIAEDGVICYSQGFEANEIIILLLNRQDDAEDTASALRLYRQERANIFAGYAPEQAALAEQGLVITHGRYVALIIGDNSGAQEAFLACFAENPPPLPASPRLVSDAAAPAGPAESRESIDDKIPTDDSYDHDAVLAAWQSGDTSQLSEKNRAILTACQNVIADVTAADMSDYEKELAVHDWIIDHADYDWAMDSRDPAAQIEPDHDNPYGLLVKGKAICSGYSSTFQLLMDLLDIECLTVHGTANSDREDHAWNLVRLDGEWYCVDVTWDDPYGQISADEETRHRFFNITSQDMRDSLHFWDEDAVPECTATQYAYGAGES